MFPEFVKMNKKKSFKYREYLNFNKYQLTVMKYYQ